LGQLQAALADCNESLRLRPDNSNTLDSRGFVYLGLGRWDDAIADSDAALRGNPRNAWALFERGIAKRRKAIWRAETPISQPHGPSIRMRRWNSPASA
jgi:tetratricopeptide (TPR) repeat protein